MAGLKNTFVDGSLIVSKHLFTSSLRGFNNEISAIYFVVGNTTGTAGVWTGTNAAITEYFDGMVINYKIGIAGASTTTLNINGLGAKTCYLRGTSKLTTHYAAGTMVLLSYNSSTNAFYSADYDVNSDTKVTQAFRSTSENRPILLSAGYTSSSTSGSSASTAYWNNQLYANPNTGTIYAKNMYINGTELATYIKQQAGVCLAEGTLITMADGSKKKIEDVKEGELLKSYDFETNKNVTSVCLGCYVGDVRTQAYYLVFSNKQKLKINWTHDIYNATKKVWCKSDSELDLGDKLINENNEEIYFAGPVDWVSNKSAKSIKFYTILSSNNIYYADGILLSHSPKAVGYWTWYKDDIPENLLNAITEYKDETFVETDLMENEDYINEHINYMAEIMTTKGKMQACKNELSKTDYIALKAQEGYEIDNHIMELRAQWRKEYNQYEIELAELEKIDNALKVKYSEFKEDVLLSPLDLRRKLFEKSCKIGNANLENFKNYYSNHKEEYSYINY